MSTESKQSSKGEHIALGPTGQAWSAAQNKRFAEGTVRDQETTKVLCRTVDLCLSPIAAEFIHPESAKFVQRIRGKVLANKRLTDNETQGLFRIERAVSKLIAQKLGANLGAVKRIGN